jgi:hypothetical protein
MQASPQVSAEVAVFLSSFRAERHIGAIVGCSANEVRVNPFAKVIKLRHAQWSFGFKVFHICEPGDAAEVTP